MMRSAAGFLDAPGAGIKIDAADVFSLLPREPHYHFGVVDIAMHG